MSTQLNRVELQTGAASCHVALVGRRDDGAGREKPAVAGRLIVTAGSVVACDVANAGSGVDGVDRQLSAWRLEVLVSVDIATSCS
jgi:hypothetical protein